MQEFWQKRLKKNEGNFRYPQKKSNYKQSNGYYCSLLRDFKPILDDLATKWYNLPTKQKRWLKTTLNELVKYFNNSHYKA